MVTNWQHYFGTPEAVAQMEVNWLSWPFRIIVYTTRRMSKVTTSSQLIDSFDSEEEYRAWLDSEYDDGTIVFED